MKIQAKQRLVNADLADRKAAKVQELEDKLSKQGYKYVKDPDGGEYQYMWVKKGSPTYVVNHRFGSKGYAEFWKV